MALADDLAQRTRYWTDQANLGYDQSERWNIYPGGECDCSSLQYFVDWECGTMEKPSGNLYLHTLYTGSMLADYTRAGYTKRRPDGMPKLGTILLNESKHVARCTSVNPFLISYASIDENGRASGGQAGDQTDRETKTVGLDAYATSYWDWYLDPPGTPNGTPTQQQPSQPSGDLTDIAQKVIEGLYGNGQDRFDKLRAEGYDPQAVQDTVNALLGAGSTGGGTTAATSVEPGTYEILCNSLNIRSGPGTGYIVAGCYRRGQSVILDGTSKVAEGYVWGRYLAYSGYYRWIAVRTLDGSVYAAKQ